MVLRRGLQGQLLLSLCWNPLLYLSQTLSFLGWALSLMPHKSGGTCYPHSLTPWDPTLPSSHPAEESSGCSRPRPMVHNFLEDTQWNTFSPHAQTDATILCKALPPHGQILISFNLMTSIRFTQISLWDHILSQRPSGLRGVGAYHNVLWDFCWVEKIYKPDEHHSSTSW